MEETVKQEPIFRIIKWNVVGNWAASDGSQGICSICKNDLSSVCLHCLSMNDPNNTCLVLEGTCRHMYHQHCLNTWLNKNQNQQCLLCKSTWNTVKTIDIKNSG